MEPQTIYFPVSFSFFFLISKIDSFFESVEQIDEWNFPIAEKFYSKQWIFLMKERKKSLIPLIPREREKKKKYGSLYTFLDRFTRKLVATTRYHATNSWNDKTTLWQILLNSLSRLDNKGFVTLVE